jgi:metal-responsive CopG/Arc/MetJ family transcriptional regulator
MDMSRTTKVLGFSVPPSVVKEVEQVAKAERRTKSELFREMFRVYKRYRQQREQDEERWVMNLIREAKDEQKTNPMSPEEMVKELKEFGQEIAQKAKERGITGKDVNRIIHAARKRWGTA